MKSFLSESRCTLKKRGKKEKTGKILKEYFHELYKCHFWKEKTMLPSL